jgi:hypothetical protein
MKNVYVELMDNIFKTPMIIWNIRDIALEFVESKAVKFENITEIDDQEFDTMKEEEKSYINRLFSIYYFVAVHRGAIYQFLFRWIYYCHSTKSTGKKTGKTHLCAVWDL